MKVLLYQLDGSLPNLALMRISSHHKALGHSVRLKQAGNSSAVDRASPEIYDKVYASLLFKSTQPLAEYLQSIRPDVVLGGTGWQYDDLISIGRTPFEPLTLEQIGITTRVKDYSIYPFYKHSIGYTQRGCRMTQKTCPWCIVPVKEGKVKPDEALSSLWRGDPYPRNLHLLDNDFFGNPEWPSVIASMREGGFKVCFNQGVNIRLMQEEHCEAVCSVQYYDTKFLRKSFYTAWDNKPDEERLFRGLRWLTKHGMKPREITIYMLIGHEPGETAADREYRRKRIREFGAFPYPMPFRRTTELVGYQRWILGHYDKRVPWKDWEAARYQPRNL